MKGYFTVMSIVVMISCNNTNQLKNETPECKKDSTILTIDTLRVNYEIYGSNYILDYYTDKYGTEFTSRKDARIRVVYKVDKKLLLVYNDEEITQKFYDILAVRTKEKLFSCRDGKYLTEKKFIRQIRFSIKNKVILNTDYDNLNFYNGTHLFVTEIKKQGEKAEWLKFGM